jgi:chromate transport protein ChrA
VAIGLAVGGLITFGRTAITGWLTLVVGLITFALVMRTKFNPVYFILGGAVVGYVALR